MNFKDLLEKMAEIDSAPTEDKYLSQPVDDLEEAGVEECGGMMPPMGAMSAPKQADSVTMNVSMNGSGAGGIKDLLGILRNIESSEKPNDIVVGMGEEYANEPNPDEAGVDAVTPTGDDLFSKGKEAEKVNGGGNPMGVDESLVSRLSNLYQEVKSR